MGGTMTTYMLDPDTGSLTVQQTFQNDNGDCGNLDTPDAGDLNTAARECAASRGWAMDDGSYPIRSKEMHGAADLEKAVRAVGRGSGSHNEIRRHIMDRASDLGLSDQIPDNWNSDGSLDEGSSAAGPTTFQNQEDDCPEGQVRGEDGECVEAGDDDDSSTYQTAAGSTAPPAWMFANPGLNRATPLTITDEGHVYGHLATWDECHVGIGNKCVTAPRSATDYAYFTVGEVVTADGARQRVGKITLGTGHADPALGFIPAAEHYENTGTVVAVVSPYEDRFGIVVAGSTVAGLNEEKLAELRRSPLSGDWRRVGGNLELVAALAVNTPGYPVIRASAIGKDELEVLLAAGVVTEPGDVDLNEDRAARWKKVEDVVRNERVRDLLGGS